MSFFGKLAFWKKSEPELSADFGDFSLPGQGGKSDLGLTEGEFTKNEAEFNSAGGFGQGSYGQSGGYGQQRSSGFGQQNQSGFGHQGQSFGQQGMGQSDFQSDHAMSRFQQVQQEAYNPSYGGQSSSQHLFTPTSQQSSTDIINSKNYEVMMSKLDAVSAQLESINQRLQNIERIAISEDRKREKAW